MLYKVGFRSANLLKVSLVTTAAMLAICLLALVGTTNTAEAEDSLPQNGKIAFTSNRLGAVEPTIYAVEPDGSNLSQLTNGGNPNWSPDGTRMTFVRQKVREGVSRGMDISIMSAEGSNLKNLPTNNLYGSYSTWLPDGTKLAFTSINGDIYTMDPDGSNQARLTNTPAYSEGSVDFSPDGSQMCVFRFGGTTGQTTGIYVMNTDGSDLTPLFEANSPVELGGCDWSPDEAKITFHAAFGSLEGFEKSDIKGGGLQKEVAKLDEEVYVINADGSGLTKVTSNSAADVEPAWSPDGKKITFASNRDGDYEIYTMDADGSDVAQVTENSEVDDTYPDWQPLPKPTPPKDADGSDEAQGTKKPGVDSVDRDRPERTVIVMPGDSLWSISEQRLGPEASPQRVYDHTYQMYALNRKRIGSDPDLIFAGQRLSLPPLGEG